MEKSVHHPDYKIFITLLRTLRKEAGCTVVELARMLNRPPSFVSKIESAERRLDIVELREVCHALGVTLPYFVNRFEQLCHEHTGK